MYIAENWNLYEVVFVGKRTKAEEIVYFVGPNMPDVAIFVGTLGKLKSIRSLRPVNVLAEEF